MVLHRKHSGNKSILEGFTLVEAVVAVSLVGIGLATSYTALTKINAFASAGRNSTGAYAAVMNQLDLLLSDSPFNPQKTNDDLTPQIPPELTLGTHTTNNVPIYRDPVPVAWTYTNAAARAAATGFVAADVGKLALDSDTQTYWRLTSTAPTWATDPGGAIVTGTLTTTITDASVTYNGNTLPIYRATVQVTYTYLGRNYSFSMSTMRASDI